MSVTQVGITPLASVGGSDGLCLSVGWSRDGGKLVSSSSAGDVNLLKAGAATLQPLHSWRAHGYEAWVVAMGQEEHLVFSGN